MKICYGSGVTDTQLLAFTARAAAYAQKYSKTYLYCETAIDYRFSQANFVEFSAKNWKKKVHLSKLHDHSATNTLFWNKPCK